MSKDAHLTCFSEIREASFDRIDYALVVADETSRPVGYITCKEFDANTTYWQHGGGFPESIGVPIFRAYQACVEWEKENHKRIFTLIENKNKRMLKMAMKVGFDIIGCKTITGSIMLEHLIEF